MFEQRFKNRMEAGKLLGRRLSRYAGRKDTIVLGLPRGGVPVAAAVADALQVPLDIMLVRKLGVPGNEELAMGAIAGGEVVDAPEIVQMFGITAPAMESAVARESKEIARREAIYRGDAPPPHLGGNIVILVDDGLATGATMLAAVRAARKQNPARVVVGVPVGAMESCDMIRVEVDEILCLSTPSLFFSVGQWYEDFSQTSDDEVVQILNRHKN